MAAKILFITTTLLYLGATAGYLAYLFFQQERFRKWGLTLFIGGFSVHTLLILSAFVQTGHFPVRNLRETFVIAGWALAGVFLGVQYRFRLKILGIIAAPLTASLMGMAAPMSQNPAQQEIIFNNFWIIFHVVVILIGNAAFGLACGVGILYLLQERAIKEKTRGFFYSRLPSLDLLDFAGYGCLVIGFIGLTLGLITGFLYARTTWGRFWSWDPKEVWSGIMWLFYAALLHERLVSGWRGKRAAVMSIIGFGMLLFTFFGVNFLFEGHHQPFTQW